MEHREDHGMTIVEAKRRVDAAIEAAFAGQQDDRHTDFVTVRVDDNPAADGAFEAFIHSPNAADHLRARMVVLDALRDEKVTFPQTRI